MKFPLVCLLFFFLCFPVCAQPEKAKIATIRTEKAIEVFSHFYALGSESLPFELFKKAKAVAVFGEIEKSRWFLNALSTNIKGYGLLTFRQETDWSQPTFLYCRGIEMGLNFNFSEKKRLGVVFLFMNDKSIELIKRGNIGANKIAEKELALGPLVKGKGAELTIEKAAILYYTFEEDKLSGEELKNTIISDAFAIKHDNELNKAIFGKKFKAILSENFNSQSLSIIEKFRQTIANGFMQ
jgi:lipid-binding SYLF domain-containing protein